MYGALTDKNNEKLMFYGNKESSPNPHLKKGHFKKANSSMNILKSLTVKKFNSLISEKNNIDSGRKSDENRHSVESDSLISD